MPHEKPSKKSTIMINAPDDSEKRVSIWSVLYDLLDRLRAHSKEYPLDFDRALHYLDCVIAGLLQEETTVPTGSGAPGSRRVKLYRDMRLDIEELLEDFRRRETAVKCPSHRDRDRERQRWTGGVNEMDALKNKVKRCLERSDDMEAALAVAFEQQYGPGVHRTTIEDLRYAKQ